MDPAGSRLLQEFGLEAETAATGSQTAETDAGAAAPVADINATVQSELTSAASANRQEKIQELSTMVREAQTPQPVFVRRVSVLLLVLILVIIPALFCIMIGSLLLWITIDGAMAGRVIKVAGEAVNPGRQALTGLAFLIPALGAIAWGVWLLRRKGKPALMVLPDGLQLAGQSSVLLWSTIRDIGFTIVNGVALAVHLDLDHQAPPPELGVSFLRGRYDKAKHRVTLTLNLRNNKTCTQVYDTIVGYWRAYQARAELRRMGVVVE